jgi:hypothetical protein
VHFAGRLAQRERVLVRRPLQQRAVDVEKNEKGRQR